MSEVLAAVLAAGLSVGLVLIVGYAFTGCLKRRPAGWSRLSLAWFIGLALATVITYFAWTGHARVTFGICVLAACALQLLRRRKHFIVSQEAAMPRWVKLVLVLAALALVLPYIEIHTAKDIYPNMVTDWPGRQSVIWSLQQLGLPAQDALFYPGRSLGLYYPAGPYLVAASVCRLVGDAAGQAAAYCALMAMTFLCLGVQVFGLAARMFGSRKAGAWAVVAMLAAGMDLPVNLALKLTGHPVALGHAAAWADASQLRVAGLFAATLWAWPHIAAGGMAIICLRWLPLSIRRRPMDVLAVAILTAGVFYFSPYVAVAWAVTVTAWLAVQFRPARWRRWMALASSLAIMAIVAAMIVVPYWLALAPSNLNPGRPAMVLAAPEASIHPLPASWGAAGEGGNLAIQMLLQFTPTVTLAILSMLWIRGCRLMRPAHKLLAIAIVLGIPLILIFKSTGMYNDWGMRTSNWMQLCGSVLAGGLLARVRWRSLQGVAIGLLIALGMGASVYEAGAETAGRFVVHRPAHRLELYDASHFVARHAPRQAVVAMDPDIEGMDMARRWMGRRSLLANEQHGSMAYTDQAALTAVRSSLASALSHAWDQRSADELSRWGATWALIPRSRLTSPDQAAYRNEFFAVIKLGPQTQTTAPLSRGPAGD